MTAVAPVAIGVEAPHQLRIALPERHPVGVDLQREGAHRLAVLARQGLAVLAFGAVLHPFAEARADRVERIGEIGPARRTVGTAGGVEGTRLALPAGKGALRVVDLVGAHPLEEVVARIERTDMLEAQPAERRRAVARTAGAFERGRAEFARLCTARLGAQPPLRLHATVETGIGSILFRLCVSHATSLEQTDYIGAMTDPASGGLADIIASRLTAALAPTQLDVINDSHHHAGHLGDDGTGESHWTVVVESGAFTGLSRVQRQRLINNALADLLAGRIHALAIRARAPGE